MESSQGEMMPTTSSSGAGVLIGGESVLETASVDLGGLSHVSDVAQTFHFSSGNPRIEEIRGFMRLFPNPVSSSLSDLPVLRKPLLCVPGVPNHMTYADFCQFCGSFIQQISEMRIFRNDGSENQYSILIRFYSQDAADGFYFHFNRKKFSSLEEEACLVHFTADVQYTGTIEHSHTTSSNSTEQPTCPVCLERLDQDSSGNLITICNHSFHCYCISKWTDSSCPVCRYCQQQPEKSICSVCQTPENLWICVICGFVGCGRYKEGHAIKHWKETQHCYALELDTQRVWDYVGDNYVHRLIQSKTDGKLVELNSHSLNSCSGCENECSFDSEIGESLLNSKVEATIAEYNDLLTSQLENQRLYFESLLQQVGEDIERDVAQAVEKRVNLRLQKMKTKLEKGIEEKRFLDDINENLAKNNKIWEQKILEMEEREKALLGQKEDKIMKLEKQLHNLMMNMEVGKEEEREEESGVNYETNLLCNSGESSKTPNLKISGVNSQSFKKKC